MVTRAQVVAEARRWIGTPFAHGHHERGRYCDCIGLVWGVATALGITTLTWQSPEMAPFVGYSRRPDPALMKQGLDRFLVPRPLERVPPGDLLWFTVVDNPQHLAIVSDNGMIIHAFEPVGRRGLVVEHRLVTFKRFKIEAAYSYPGIVD